MKKFLAVLLFTAMVFALAIPVAALDITAPKATIALDGVRDDAYAGPWDIKYFNEGNPGATGQVWTAWDDDYIYLYFEIDDKTPNHEHGNHYERDCVEVFFDWYNGKDDDTSDDEKFPYWQYRFASAPNEDGQQFSLNINWASLGWGDFSEEYNAAGNTVVKPLSGSDLKNGYIVETRIPYKSAGIKIAEGSVLGADFMIGDNQEDSGRSSMTFPDPDFTSNNQYQHPFELGVAFKLGAAPLPPVVEAPPEEAAPVVNDAASGGGEAADAEIVPVIVAATPAPVSSPITSDSMMIVVLTMALLGAFVITKRAKNKI